MLFVGLAAGLAALGLEATVGPHPSPGRQADAAAVSSDVGEREAATNRALLDALLRRRGELARLPATDGTRAALAFLDERLAQLRQRLAE